MRLLGSCDAEMLGCFDDRDVEMLETNILLYSSQSLHVGWNKTRTSAEYKKIMTFAFAYRRSSCEVYKRY